MTVTAALLALWAVLAIAGDTPIGRFLHRATVELPATALNRIIPGHVLLALMLIGFCGLMACYGEADGVRMLSMAVPDIAVWLVTVEVGAYLDAVAALVATFSAMRLKGARDRIAAAITLLTRRPSGNPRPRCSRQRGDTAPANDDEDGAGLALAS